MVIILQVKSSQISIVPDQNQYLAHCIKNMSVLFFVALYLRLD